MRAPFGARQRVRGRAERAVATIALSGVTIKPKYVNMADIMADISLTTSDASPRPAAAELRPPSRREPYWDLIELLFFAYRDFVGDPDEVLASSASAAPTTGCCISSTAIPA